LLKINKLVALSKARDREGKGNLELIGKIRETQKNLAMINNIFP